MNRKSSAQLETNGDKLSRSIHTIYYLYSDIPTRGVLYYMALGTVRGAKVSPTYSHKSKCCIGSISNPVLLITAAPHSIDNHTMTLIILRGSQL